ncbi:aminotransferase family protein [Streptomyces daliensis]|uniref:Aspartate aminotransferase family protein n=1 Tax=Streptomyces daliensis TaxID=299421 RepID=A0A8T4IWW0_9ACTN|nr:aspartate aminotransferase family protein [Streptomyces daliensis]
MNTANGTNSANSVNALWHNHAHMPTMPGREHRIVRGAGAYVYDDAGRELLDVPAGLWFANVGHGRAEIADAVHRQLSELATYPVFGDFCNPRAEELADRIAGLVPVEDAKVFFTSGGSEALEAAVKLVRRYWQLTGEPARQTVITREGGYHGLHGFGTSIVGVPAFREGFGALLPGALTVPAMDLAALEAAILAHGPDRIAAFLCEPVIAGGAGVVPPADGYLTGAQELCREHGIVFMLDEVVTGFGRAGSMFAAERYGLRPDIMLLAKGLTSGYLPLGAAVAGGRVAEAFWAPGSPHVFQHGLTYSGHASACAAALANLDILEREDLVGRVRSREGRLLEALLPLREHPLVADVRGGTGLMAAVALRGHDVAEEVAHAVVNEGMLMRVTGGDALQISPPFVIGDEDIDRIPVAISAALSRVSGRRSRAAAPSSRETPALSDTAP